MYREINFDMDGTIADLYGVENWLPLLRAEDTAPYEMAKPLVNMSRLARAIHKAQRNGIDVGVISWGSKGGTTNYLRATEIAKKEWLARHLPSVVWDSVQVVDYGIPKESLAEIGDILFDDNAKIRQGWGEKAYEPDQIFTIFAAL